MHLPDAMEDSNSLLNQAHVHCQSGTGGSTVEKPAETQTGIWLDSHLVRAPNSRSCALTKIAKILGVRFLHCKQTKNIFYMLKETLTLSN